MAVSKRTRYEVLRRDNHTCRYCHAIDSPLTVDHVIPTALGGSDDPSNLVASCKDCNAGKSSAHPDDHLVAEVNEDAVRWARAMAMAAEEASNKRAAERLVLDHWLVKVWGVWTWGDNHIFELAENWESTILRLLNAGLVMDDLAEAVDVTMHANYVRRDHFRYFIGVCHRMLTDRREAASAIIERGEA